MKFISPSSEYLGKSWPRGKKQFETHFSYFNFLEIDLAVHRKPNLSSIEDKKFSFCSPVFSDIFDFERWIKDNNDFYKLCVSRLYTLVIRFSQSFFFSNERKKILRNYPVCVIFEFDNTTWMECKNLRMVSKLSFENNLMIQLFPTTSYIVVEGIFGQKEGGRDVNHLFPLINFLSHFTDVFIIFRNSKERASFMNARELINFQ